MIGKIRDTAIGLWPVLKTYMPRTRDIVIALLALFGGLFIAYRLDPVKFFDSDPSFMSQDWQDQWVRMADSTYRLGTVNQEPSLEFQQSIQNLLQAVDDPAEIANRIGVDPTVAQLAAQAGPFAPQPPERPNIWAEVRPWLLGSLATIALVTIGSLLFGFYINPMVVEPIRKRIRGATGDVDVQGAASIKAIQEGRIIRDQLAKEAAATPAPAVASFGPPVVRHVSIYNPGRAYDDSFSIEDAKKDDEFLGECGAVISETIGAGSPEKVTAIEVWLFDKEDFVRTLTGVFVSEHAMNDPAITAKLGAKGELVVARPGAVIMLETKTLRMQARVVDLTYGTGPLPPNSYFDKMTIELQSWRRAAGDLPSAPTMPAAPVFPAAPAPVYSPPPVAATPSFATPPPQQPAPSFSPPPQVGFSSPPPQAAPQVGFPPPNPAPRPVPTFQPPPPQAPFGGGLPPARPAAPPPLPRREDDDPFGGTGDFTPVN
jgi:hypothetical protein